MHQNDSIFFQKDNGVPTSFVTICVDELYMYKMWIARVGELFDSEDDHVIIYNTYADLGLKSYFVKQLGINNVPRAVILDTDATVLDADAPLPHHKSAVKQNLQEYLQLAHNRHTV